MSARRETPAAALAKLRVTRKITAGTATNGDAIDMPQRPNRSRLATVATLTAAAGAYLAVSTSASGQDGLPPQGEFSLTFSLVDMAAADPVAIGPNQVAQAVNQIAHLFNDDGSGFLHYAVGRCASFQIIDLDANTIDISGYCNYRDGDGDHVFERFATDGAVALDAVTIDSEWTGGTGKYADIEGTFTTEAFGVVAEGNAMLVGGSKVGAYQIASAIPEPEPEPAPAPAPAPVEDDPALLADLIDEGATVFRRNCTSCHGSEGGGSDGPSFINSQRLSSTSTIMTQVIDGGAYMPPFNGLSNREVAAVGTFIRNSFGNEFGILSEERVARYRGN